MSAWRWACVECGSPSLEFMTRHKRVRCKPKGHISDKVEDMDTGIIVLVSERRFTDTSLLEEKSVDQEEAWKK